MSHQNFEHKLLQYFYAELSEKDRAEFEAHLAGCEECRKELNSLNAISIEFNREFDKAQVETEVWERILEAAEAKTNKGLLSYLWPRPLVARMAVSLALAALLIFVVRAGIERWSYRHSMNLTSWPLASQIGLLEQDLSMNGASSNGTAAAEGLEEEDNWGIAILSSGLEPSDDAIDSLDEDLGEVEEISGGIFEL